MKCSKLILESHELIILKLSDEICSELQVSRLRTYFYDCMPVIRKDTINEEADKLKHTKKQKFIDKILL